MSDVSEDEDKVEDEEEFAASVQKTSTEFGDVADVGEGVLRYDVEEVVAEAVKSFMNRTDAAILEGQKKFRTGCKVRGFLEGIQSLTRS